MSCPYEVLAGRFQSRQRQTMREKSENSRCKSPKNRNAVKFIFMLEKTQKGNKCRPYDENEKGAKTLWLQQFSTKLNGLLQSIQLHCASFLPFLFFA